MPFHFYINHLVANLVDVIGIPAFFGQSGMDMREC